MDREKMRAAAREVPRLMKMLIDEGAVSAVCYQTDKLVTRLTRRLYDGKASRGREEFNLTIGEPNYAERAHLKRLKADGISQRIRLRYTPKPRPAGRKPRKTKPKAPR